MSAVQRWKGTLDASFILFLAGAAALTWRLWIFGPFNHLRLAGLYSIFILKVFTWPHSVLAQLMRAGPLVWCGQVSYGIYLLHQAMSGLLHGLLRHQAPQIHTLSDALITLPALCVTFVVAAASYRYLPMQQEQPLSTS
jgi:peptidoglycan/LPS O-acetylase OafA/YrhL